MCAELAAAGTATGWSYVGEAGTAADPTSGGVAEELCEGECGVALQTGDVVLVGGMVNRRSEQVGIAVLAVGGVVAEPLTCGARRGRRRRVPT